MIQFTGNNFKWIKTINKTISIINVLRSYSLKLEWFEFKNPDALEEYISSISNSAAIDGKKEGYFLWGIYDKTHETVGTNFNPNQDINNKPLNHYLSRKLSPSINFTFKEIIMDTKRVVLLTIPAAKTIPTSYANERYIRIGSNKENIRKYLEKEVYLFKILRNGQPTLENTSSLYQDLTFEKLLMLLRRKRHNIKNRYI